MDEEPLKNITEAAVPETPTKRALGAAAELHVASRFALLGYQVYRPLADDRGIDLLIDLGQGRHAAVQVKALGAAKGGYVYMRKSTYELQPWMFLALVVYAESLDDQPSMYFIPATEWKTPQPPFFSYEYDEGKSAPEYSLSLRAAWKEELAKWADDIQHVRQILRQASFEAEHS